jgi:hypothetical protein
VNAHDGDSQIDSAADIASPEAALPTSAEVEQDLFERVQGKVNKEPVKALLAEYQHLFPGEISTSGNKPELVEQLRDACTVGRIPRTRVFELLRECEENGNQTVLYYSPKTAAAAQACENPMELANRLFGANWHQIFPRLPRLTSGYQVVDFRIGLRAKPRDWLLKLYTYQESNVRVHELPRSDPAVQAVGLRDNEYVVVYERKITESVCLIRWNDHPRHKLLELRVELSGRLARFEADVKSLWTSVDPIFQRDEDFEPWELERALGQMLRECQHHPDLYQLGLAHLVDSGEGGVKYVPYTERDSIDATPIRLQTITQILDDGGRCSRLATIWLAEGSGGALEENLRTHAGPRRTNELVIAAQATSRAVDYATDQLRYFTV